MGWAKKKKKKPTEKKKPRYIIETKPNQKEQNIIHDVTRIDMTDRDEAGQNSSDARAQNE